MRRSRRAPPVGSPALTVARNEWVGGRFRAPAYVTGEGPAYRPDVVLWLELGREHLHSARLVRASEPNQVIVAALDDALVAAGARQRPRRVRVADRATAELLRAHFGSSLEVLEGPTPEIEPVLEDMAHRLGGQPDAGYLTGGATPEQVGRLFAAAAKLYRVAPWRIVADDRQLLAVEAPGLGLKRGCVSVIGALGEEDGILLFQSLADFGRFVEASERNERGDRPKRLGFTLTSLTFTQGSEIAPEARREIARHGWEVASVHAYPTLMIVEADFVERPPTARDVVLATAAVEGVARFMDAHRALFAEPAPVPERETYAMPGLGGETTIAVVAPHPEAPWDREPTAAEAELLRHLEEQAAEAEKRAEAFAAAASAAGRDATWVGAARVVAKSLLDFKVYEHDGHLDDLTAEAVERYLVDWVPARMACPDEVLDRMPDVLATLVEWLAGEGLLTPAKTATIRRRIEAVRGRFRRNAADPARFSAAKVLALEAQREGVDPSDEAAMRRFVGRRGALRMGAYRSASAAAPRPNDPCPCGSGRKYKKCCRPH